MIVRRSHLQLHRRRSPRADSDLARSLTQGQDAQVLLGNIETNISQYAIE